jgi:hypothetical protein
MILSDVNAKGILPLPLVVAVVLVRARLMSFALVTSHSAARAGSHDPIVFESESRAVIPSTFLRTHVVYALLFC